ncbi:hypothetical protein FHG87_001056 [Trinorchestia longiramus]|nr:hypothetical protein FHG87_001056 [Trinorchestia longiramus]
MLVLSRSEDAEESHLVRRSPSESSQRNTSGNPALRELLEGLISSTMSSSSPENQDLRPQISEHGQDDDANLPPEFAENSFASFDVSLDESLFELLNLLGSENRNKRKVNEASLRNPLQVKDPKLFSQFGEPSHLIHSRTINFLSSHAQTRKLDDSGSVFSLDDGSAMMKMIRGMPREFKLRFIALLLRSDRRGLQEFLREVIAFHMRSEKDDDALQSNAVGSKLSDDRETSQGTGKSLQSSRLTNGHQNEDDVQLMSPMKFASRRGSPAKILISNSENIMPPNIKSAVILHRETISEPGKILKVIPRQKGKSIKSEPSFHPNAQLRALRNKPVAVPQPAKLHHFIRQSSASGQPTLNASRSKTTLKSSLLPNAKNSAGEASSISSSDLSHLLERIRNTPAFTGIVNNIMELLNSDDARTKLSSMQAFSNSGKSLQGPGTNPNQAITGTPVKEVSRSTSTAIKNTVGVPFPLPGNLDTRIDINAARQPPLHLNNSHHDKDASTQQVRLRAQNPGAQFGSELSTIENQLRGAIEEQQLFIGSSERNKGLLHQNKFASSRPDFSNKIIGFSRTAFNPSPVLTVQPQTIVPLSTDIEGQLFDEAIKNFKDETQGSSITAGNFVDDDRDFKNGVLNFVPLSTDITGQLTDVPEITADEPQQVTGQVLTNNGVPLPVGQSINSAQAVGPGGFALALADFSQTGRASGTNNQIPNNSEPSNSVGIPFPSINSTPQQTFRNPVTIADILRTQSEDSFDVTLQKATNGVSPLQTAGGSLPQTIGVDENTSPFSRDEQLPGKSLSLSNSDTGNFDLNSLPATDIFGNPIGVPLPELQDIFSSSKFPSAQSNVGQNNGPVGISLPTGETSSNSGTQNFLNSLPETDIFGNVINTPRDHLPVTSFNEQEPLTDTQNVGSVGVPLPSFSADNQATNDFNTAQQTDIFGNIINIPLSNLQNVRFLSSSEEILPGNVGVALPPFSRNFTSSNTPFNFNNHGDVTGHSVGVPLPSFQNEAGSQNLPPQSLGDVGVSLPAVSSNFNVHEELSDQGESHDQFSFLSSLTDSNESVEADDIFIGSGFSSQTKSNFGGYDVIDEKGYPSNSKKHKLVTFFSSGLLLPFTEREVMYKKEKNQSPQYFQQPPQPPKYNHHFRVYQDGQDPKNQENSYANHRVPSLTYTVPPLLDSTYAARSLACQSRTVVTTSVLLVDLPTSLTTLTEFTTAVQLVKSYYVTPVTVAQTYTAHNFNTVAQYQLKEGLHCSFEVNIISDLNCHLPIISKADNRQKDFPEPTTVQRLPAISLLAPSSLFNTVDTETGAKKTYSLPTKKSSDGPQVIHLQAVKFVRRRRSPDFDPPLVHKLAGVEVSLNGSERIPFIVDQTVHIGEQPRYNTDQQHQAIAAHQDSVIAANQQHTSHLQQDYSAPILNQYSLPTPSVQNEYTPPVQNEYSLPVQNEYTPPVQNEYSLPVQNEYTPPVQNEYSLPVQNEYTPPVQIENSLPVQNEYTPPVQNEYSLPVQNEYTPPVQIENSPPVQNEYTPPVQNENSPPVQNENTAPPQQKYNLPVSNNYNLPQQNYALPIQNEYIPPARSLYAPASTVIVTTVLRTMTSMVPRTLVGTNYRVSTVTPGQTATTIRSTSVYCLQPEQRRGQYNQYTLPVQSHSATPPLPISPHNTKHDHVPTAFVRPTPSLKSDSSSYQTWVGAVVGADNGYSSPHDSDLPSKFILLQNLKPQGFVVEDGSKNGGTRVKLSHDERKYGGILNRKLNLDSVSDSDIGVALSNRKGSYQSPQRR